MCETQQAVTSREFAEWLAYDRLEPIDVRQRVDLAAGIVSATTANCHRGRGDRAYRPGDFMPRFDAAPRRQAPEQMHAIFAAFAKAHNEAERAKAVKHGVHR